MARKWYKEQFDELYLQSYGMGQATAAREAESMLDKLDLDPGAEILDLACGQGRHAVEMAKRGYSVTGLDLSKYLLTHASSLAAQAGVEVELVEEDMRRVPETWAARFDGIINVFTAFGYYDKDADNEKVIEAVARSLKLEGRFVLDIINRDWLIRNFHGRSWREGEHGFITVEETRIDLLTSRSHATNTIIKSDGTRVVRELSLRLYTLAEIRAMLERHGFEVVETFGGWGDEPYSMNSRRMIVLAQRKK
ncbi:MAG TPA: methyltransferase domain-containing protein [Armatimonadota bacterium]|nr:methyltransferase domain-containing protein [Armatimonadota bacterium]